jgi:hypothetical protein
MRVLDRLEDTPAQVVSDLAATLVQNRLAVALLGDQTRFTGLARSGVYRWFTDPDERRRYPEADHDHQSRVWLSDLRAALARGGRDARAESIVERLREQSPEFARLWDVHEVAVRADDHKTIIHPELGDIELDCQKLSTQNQAQALLVFTASPAPRLTRSSNCCPPSAPNDSALIPHKKAATFACEIPQDSDVETVDGEDTSPSDALPPIVADQGPQLAESEALLGRSVLTSEGVSPSVPTSDQRERADKRSPKGATCC